LVLVVSILALLGNTQWALVALAGLVGLMGVVSRVEFAFRRRDLRLQKKEARSLRNEVASQRKDARDTRRGVQETLQLVQETRRIVQGIRRDSAASFQRMPDVATDIGAIRAEVRGMRVAQQLISQSISATRSEMLAGAESLAAMQGVVSDAASSQTEIVNKLRDTRRRLVREAETVRTDIADANSRAAYHRRQLRSELMTDMQALTQLMAHFAPTAPLPLVAGWALSPSGLLYLTNAIERREVELVVECGSGTSTLWMALAMRRKGSGKVIALEHQEEYAARTRAVLEAHGVSEWAEVRVAPLISTTTPRGEFQWYDIDVDTLPGPIDILFVDGPPGTTGRYARYAALPSLAPVLAANGLIVLDDADRAEERDVLAFWLEEMSGLIHLPSPGHGIEALEAAPA